MKSKRASIIGNLRQHGFTLVEIAMVMLIIGLLLAGLVPTISSQMEQQQINETRKRLNEIKEALIGYAVINGRLPCPAFPDSSGVEKFAMGGNASNGNCSGFYNGFVPAATLGLSDANSAGFAIDAWNNRIRYAVTQSNIKAFTTSNGMSLTGFSALSPDLLVCSTATGISGSSCAANTSLTANPGVPVVIYSTGKNGGYAGTSTDEAANPNPNSADNDRTFVSHDPTPAFDDLMLWISSNILIGRMVAAGKLP